MLVAFFQLKQGKTTAWERTNRGKEEHTTDQKEAVLKLIHAHTWHQSCLLVYRNRRQMCDPYTSVNIDEFIYLFTVALYKRDSVQNSMTLAKCKSSNEDTSTT
jgi:hypothetical protein